MTIRERIFRSVINLVKALCLYLVVQVPCVEITLFPLLGKSTLARILSTSSLGSAGSLWPIGTMQGFVFMDKPVPVKSFPEGSSPTISPLVIQYSHL